MSVETGPSKCLLLKTPKTLAVFEAGRILARSAVKEIRNPCGCKNCMSVKNSYADMIAYKFGKNATRETVFDTLRKP
jgi:hypothetical protein